MPDLVAIRGDTNIFNITVIRGDAVLNITGSKVWFTAKVNKEDVDSSAIIKLDSSTPDVNIYAPVQGRVQVKIPPSATEGLDDDLALHYDVQLKEANGDITTIATGILRIEPDITRSIT